MDPLTIPLALGCILTFSHVDHAMTEEYGQTPDGVMYKTAVLTDAQGRQRVLEDITAGKGLSPGASFAAGRSPDGLFASYVVLEYAAGHNVATVRFVSAGLCAPVDFVRVRNGTAVDTVSFEGWLQDLPHGVRVLTHGYEYELGLPIDEARVANPSIKE